VALSRGKTVSSENDENLSLDVLSDDLLQLIQTLYPDPANAPTLVVRRNREN
jgi:protein phosphatase methylesterase 1